MYASRATQLIVGLFAVLGVAALAFLSLRLGKIELITPPSYVIYGNFDNIAGLKNGADIEIAGVGVGKVIDITLNNERARVAMRLNDGVKVDEDAVAAVRTRGIIGDKYIAISPGASDKYVTNGGTLRQTESSFVLEDAIGQLIGGISGGGKSQSEAKGSGSNANDLGSSPPSAAPQASPKPAQSASPNATQSAK